MQADTIDVDGQVEYLLGGGGVDQIFRPWRICLAVDRGNFRDRATLVK